MPIPLRRKKIFFLSAMQCRALIEAYCLEYGQEYRRTIIAAVNFLKELLVKTKVPVYPRDYIVSVLQKYDRED